MVHEAHKAYRRGGIGEQHEAYSSFYYARVVLEVLKVLPAFAKEERRKYDVQIASERNLFWAEDDRAQHRVSNEPSCRERIIGGYT